VSGIAALSGAWQVADALCAQLECGEFKQLRTFGLKLWIWVQAGHPGSGVCGTVTTFADLHRNMVRREAKEALAPKEKPSGAVRLEAFKQTRLCKFHIAGNCIRGTSCNFAHSIEQIRDQPDFSKTRLCVDYCTDQWCRDGDHCKFAHGEHELRPHPASNGLKKEEKEAEMTVMQGTLTQEKSPKSKQVKSPQGNPSKSLFKSPTWFEEGCWFGADAMSMYPWLAFVEYQFADDFGWDTNSQLSGDWNEWNEWNDWNEWNEWNEWNPASSNNSTTCTESPIQGPIENPMVPDGGLIFDLNPGCTSFQHELRVKNTFLHIDVTDSEDEDGQYASPSLRRSPSAPSRLVMLGGLCDLCD